MRKMLSIVLLSGLISTSVAATPIDRLENAVNGYMQALKSDNPGLRSSALHNLARLKSDYPELKLDIVDDTLLNISEKDQLMLLRVHAKLTFLYLNDAKLAKMIKVKETQDPQQFFIDLHEQIHDSFADYQPIQ